MTKAVFSDYYYLRPPEILIFDGKTDKEGKLHKDFGGKEILLGSNFELSLDKFSIDQTRLFNIYEDQYFLSHEVPGSGITREKLPAARVVRIGDLLELLSGLSFMNFTYPADGTTRLDLKKGVLKLPTPIARCLHLCDANGKVSRLARDLNPGFALSGDEEFQLLDARAASVPFVLFGLSSEENVWNIVSSNSFQAVLVYSDLVVTEIVGNARVNIVGSYPLRETDKVYTMSEKNPLWRRVEKRHVRDCFVQLADIRGRPFEGVPFSVQCRLRRRNLK